MAIKSSRTQACVIVVLLMCVMMTAPLLTSVADGVGVEKYHTHEILHHGNHLHASPISSKHQRHNSSSSIDGRIIRATALRRRNPETNHQEEAIISSQINSQRSQRRNTLLAQSTTTTSSYVPPPTQDPYDVYTLPNRSVLAIHALQQLVKQSRNASRTLQWQSEEVISSSRAYGRMEHVFPIAFPPPSDAPLENDGISKSEWIRRRDRERRRLRIATYFVPAPGKYTCTALNQLVQAFMISATSAFQCRDFEVLKPTTIPKLKKLVMPIVEQWISQNLLRPETEPYIPLFVNKSLGKCTGMIPLIPLEHLNQRRVNFTGNPSSMGVEEKWGLGGITAASGLEYKISLNRAGGAAESAKYVKAVTPPQRAASGSTKIPPQSSSKSTTPPPASVLRGGGGHPPDVIIYVTTMFEYGYISASVCQRHPISNRPTIIHLNVDPGTLDISFNQLDQAMGTKIDNSLIEIMSFTALMQAFVTQAGLYVDSPTPLSTIGTNFSATPAINEGEAGLARVQNAQDVFNFSYVRSASSSSIAQFKHPVVREWAKDFYNCPSPFYNDATVGVYNISNITNTSIIPSGNGSIFTTPLGLDAYYIPSGVNQFISYYPRFHSGDSLSWEYLSTRITNVSMMLLESTGWFEVDYYRAVGIRFNPFGAGAGCSFQAKKCNQQDYLLPPRITPSNEYPYSAIRYPGSKADTNSQAFGIIKEVHFNSTEQYDEIVVNRPDLTTPLERVQLILEGTKYSNASILQSSFCFSESAGRRCHVNRKFHAACQVLAYSAPLPTEYQYYPDRTNLGGLSTLDYCPTYFNSPTYCNSHIEVYGFVQNDIFCFDAVEGDSYEVSIGEDPDYYNHLASSPTPRGGESGRKIPKVSVSVPILKTSNAPKCLKVEDCDSNTTSYSIYEIQTNSGGGSSYVLAGRCEGVGVATGIFTKGSPPLFISVVGGVTYACAPFEVVCSEITQQTPTLQPPLQALKNYSSGVYMDSISGSDGTSVIDDPMEASTFDSVNFTFVPFPSLYQQRPLLSPSDIRQRSETFQENINVDSWRSFSRVVYNTPAYNGFNASSPPPKNSNNTTTILEDAEMYPYQVKNLSFMVSAKPKLRASLRFGGLLVFTLPAGGMLHCAEQLPSFEDYNFDVQEFETARINRLDSRPHDVEDSSSSYWSKMFSLNNRSTSSGSDDSSEVIALLVLPLFTGNDDSILNPTTNNNNPARTVNTLVHIQSPLFQCNWKSTSPNAAFYQGDPGSFDEVSLYSMLPSISVLPSDAFQGYHADAVVSDVVNRLQYGLSNGMTMAGGGSSTPKALSLDQLISKIDASSSAPSDAAANYLEGISSSPFSSTSLSDRRKTLFIPNRLATKRDVNFDTDDMSLFLGELANTNGDALLQTKVLEYTFPPPDVELTFAMLLNQQTSRPRTPSENLRWSSDSDVIYASVAYLPQIINSSSLSEDRYKNLRDSTATFLLEVEALHDPSTAATDSTLRITIGLAPSSSTPSPSTSESLLFDSGSISLSIDSLDGALFNPSSPPTMDEVNSDLRFASMYTPKREDALDPSILASRWQLFAWLNEFGDKSASPLGTAAPGINQQYFHTAHPVTTTTLPTTGFNCSVLVFQQYSSSSTPTTSRQLFTNIPRIEGLVSEGLFVDNFIGGGSTKMWEEWAPSSKPDDRIFYEGPLIYFKVKSDYPERNISAPTSSSSSTSGLLLSSSQLVGCAAYQFDVDGISYQRVTPNHRQVSVLQSNAMHAPIVPPLRAVGALFGWDAVSNTRRAFLGNLSSGGVTRNISLGNNNYSTTTTTSPPAQQTLRTTSSSLRLFPTLGQWGDGVVADMVYTASYGHKKSSIYLEISLPLMLTARGAVYGQAMNFPPALSLMPLSVDGLTAAGTTTTTTTGSDGTYSGVKAGDRINIVLDGTRFNWKDEMSHPWPNVTSTFYGCEPGVEVTVSGIWSYQRLSIVITNITRRTPLPSNYSSIFDDKSVTILEAGVSFETLTSRIPFATKTAAASEENNKDKEDVVCNAAPGSVVAIFMEGFFSEGSSNTYSCSIEYVSSVGLVNAVTGTRIPGYTAPTTIASLRWSSSTTNRQTVAPRDFISVCSNRGYNKDPSGPFSECKCNAGFAGPSCSFCSTPSNIGVSDAPCTSSCSDRSEEELPWKQNCTLARGTLNPRDMCRCYCKGVVCFVPVTTPTPSTTLPPTPTNEITISKTITITTSIPPYVTPIGTPSRTPSIQGGTETQQPTHTIGSGRVLSLDMHLVLSFNTTTTTTTTLSPSSTTPSSTQQGRRDFQEMSETSGDGGKRGPSQSDMEGGIIIGVEAVTSKRLFSDTTEITTSEKLYPLWSEAVCRGAGGGSSKFGLMLEKYNTLLKTAHSQVKTIANITCSQDRTVLYFHLSSVSWRINSVSGSAFAFLRLFPYGRVCQDMNQTLGKLFQQGSLPTNQPQDPTSCQLAATLIATIDDAFISEIGASPGNVTFDITSGLSDSMSSTTTSSSPSTSTAGSIAALRGAIGLVVHITSPRTKYSPQILTRASSSSNDDHYSLLRRVATLHRVTGFIGAIIGTITNPWLVVLDVQLSGLISLFAIRANGVCVHGELSCVSDSQSEFDTSVLEIENQLRPYGPLSLEEVQIRKQALGERPTSSYLSQDTRGVSERYSAMMLLMPPLSSGFLADWQLMFFVAPQYDFLGYTWKDPGEYESFYLAISLGFMGIAVSFVFIVSVVRKIDCKKSSGWVRALRYVAPFSAVMSVLLCCLFSQNVFRAAEAIAAMVHTDDDSTTTVQWKTKPATYSDGVSLSSNVGVAVSTGFTFALMLCSYIGLCGLYHQAKLIIVKKVHFFPYDRLLASSVGQGWLFWSLGKTAYLTRAKEGGDIVADPMEGEGDDHRLDLDLFDDDDSEDGGSRHGKQRHSRTYLIERRLRAKAEILNRYLNEMLQADRSDDNESNDGNSTSDDDDEQHRIGGREEPLLLAEGGDIDAHPPQQRQQQQQTRRIKQHAIQINNNNAASTSSASSGGGNKNQVVDYIRHTCSVSLLRMVTAVYIAVTPPTLLPQGYWDVAAITSPTPSSSSSKSRRRRISTSPSYARAVSNVESSFCWLTRQQVAGSRRIQSSSSTTTPRRRATKGGGNREEGNSEIVAQHYAKNTEDFVGATALAAAQHPNRTSARGGSSVSPSHNSNVRNKTESGDRRGGGEYHSPTSSTTPSRREHRRNHRRGSEEAYTVTVVAGAASGSGGGGDESDTAAYPKRQYRPIAGVLQAATQFTTPVGLCSVLLFRNALVGLLLGLSGRYQICNGPHGDERLPPSVITHEDGAVISVALIIFLAGWFVVLKASFVQPLQRIILALTTIAIPTMLMCTYYADKLIKQQDELIVDTSSILAITAQEEDGGYRSLHDALLIVTMVVMIVYDVVVYVLLIPVLGLIVNVIEPVVLRSVEEALCLCEENADHEATEEMHELTVGNTSNSKRGPQHHQLHQQLQYDAPLPINSNDRRPSYTNHPPHQMVDDAPLPLQIASLPNRRAEYAPPKEEDDDLNLELDT